MGLDGVNCPAHRLENIDENGPASWMPASVHPPETPTESMEFLARSWSVSATELSKALSTTHAVPKNFEKTTFGFLGDELDIENHMTSKDYGVEPLQTGDSPPVSPRGSDETKLYKSILKGKTMGKRVKDQKERKKHEMRTHNAQLHAAVSVAGVAAAVAALTASNATLAEMSTEQQKGPSKTPAAIASAAALVASHCIEIAEDMGADHDQILTAVNSAVNARTNGDVMTLTAAAATALRGAATLKARLQKGYGAAALVLGEQAEDGKDLNCMTAMNFVMRGGELLKRTRKVIVSGVHSDIAAWPGREHEGNAEQKDYFGIQTADRVIEFECNNKCEKQMWADGIHHLLHCRISTPFP
ncbi:hypothetical protein Cgig2_002165 [Carnegiea gigantea]|uniref:VAN3-binding protein n=1 Tax=Carnegiea gigantea TaxID=171969 RepID=A0A9Q1QSA5_9CARY|nr:hypothetical protein Cgig2_002165 [Carnegiea gigantea]